MPYIQEARFDVGSFEFFMRHCEAWSLDALRAVDTQWHDDREADTGGNSVAPASNYDFLPGYSWNPEFLTAEYALKMFRSDDRLFREALIPMLCSRLGHRYLLTENNLKDHLTRKLRCQIHGRDLQSVMSKDIITPLFIPYDVEERIRSLLYAEKDLPSHIKPDELLIPVYDPSNESARGELPLLPQLQDLFTGEGNLRCQNFYERFEGSALGVVVPLECTDRLAASHMARVLRRRAIVLPDGPTPEIMTPYGLSKSEATLFRAWVFAKPKNHGETDDDCNHLPDGFQPNGFTQHDTIQYPTPDELFWTDGDEGSWTPGSVPQWERYTDDEIARLEALERQPVDPVDKWKARFMVPRYAG
ncbi:hypothetical protein MMC17_009860 [Xylographa soralifera]|nr:hypothetical protein [Xylographa soralifera]